MNIIVGQGEHNKTITRFTILELILVALVRLDVTMHVLQSFHMVNLFVFCMFVFILVVVFLKVSSLVLSPGNGILLNDSLLFHNGIKK